MSGKVTDRDTGWSGFVARCRQVARGATVKVGVLVDAPKQAREGGSSDLSLVEVAAIHEFGAPEAGIPQRSFIRATVDARASEIAELQHDVAVRVVKGDTSVQAGLDEIGSAVAGMVREAIDAGVGPPLAAATAKAKGSSSQLVDTGQLKSSITWISEV